jgi:2-(1,2-epoxy-1,2-dihydrophenyl)acetyl-CoA isomerase
MRCGCSPDTANWLVDSVTDLSRDTIRCQATGSVLTITLDRPDKGNALRNQDCIALADALDAVDGAGDIRAVLIRSEGRHFCVGADLVSANAPGERPTAGHLGRALAAGPHRMIASVWNCAVPTVSAVAGRAIGLGLHLAVACDFTVAASGAWFSEPFRNRGFSVDSGGSFLLPRLIGVRRSRQMLLRGSKIDADTALLWGLIDEVSPEAALAKTTEKLAAELAAGPTFSLGHTKHLLNRWAPATLDAALAAETHAVEATVRSADFKEGLRAFTERRDPAFTGR